MSTHVKLWCQQCLTCQQAKDPTPKSLAPLKPYIAGYRMERIHVDILGPFHPATPKKGHRVHGMCHSSLLDVYHVTMLPSCLTFVLGFWFAWTCSLRALACI